MDVITYPYWLKLNHVSKMGLRWEMSCDYEQVIQVLQYPSPQTSYVAFCEK